MSNDEKKLSIYIPSYNRPEKLLQTLENLCEQLVSAVTIVVLDNHSEVDYKSFCLKSEPKLARFVESNQLVFIRNEQNVGMSANFMKAFETCKAEWLWMVADDDDIHSNAISNAFEDIEKVESKEDVVWVKFKADCCEPKEGGQYLNNLNELIDTLGVSNDYFNSFIFLTNGLYRMKYFRDEIATGYHYGNTYVPHLMMVINCMARLDGSAKIFMSPRAVATYVVPEMGYSYGLLAGIGVGSFKNFTYNLTPKQYRKLEAAFACHNDFKVAIDLYYQAKYSSNAHVGRRLMDNYYLQIKRGRTLLQRMALKAFLTLFYFPILAEFFIGTVAKLSPLIGRHIEEMKLRYNK
jgi:glycosyltransferase involved in cell wall biosynthesis